MKYKKFLSLLLCIVMVLSMAGCGGGEVVPVDETKKLPNGVINGSTTYVDNEDDPLVDTGDMEGLGDLGSEPGGIVGDGDLPGEGDVNHPEANGDGEGESGDYEDEPSGNPGSSGDFSVAQPDDTGEGPGSGTVNRPSANGGSGTTAAYRFQKYVLSNSETDNFVFSGEAILTAVDMWSEMILDPEHKTIEKYLARDYIAYESHGGMEMINRIWVDDPLDTGDGAGRLTSVFYQMDMSAETATADKDEWVSSRTDGYITSTPAKYSDKTKVDVMSVPYFADTWKAGTMSYDTKVRAFQNADGTETRTYMCWSEGLTYWDMGNAKAYCMYLTGGNYIMFIVPNEGVSFDKVDVSGLMAGKIESSRAHVAFFVPVFETESEHTLNLGNFGLPSGKVGSDVISNLSKAFEPVLTQQTKISVTPYGIGPISEGTGRPEQVLAPSATDYDDDDGFVRIVCDRPFMYYVGDAWNEDIAFFGVLNNLPADQAVQMGASD